MNGVQATYTSPRGDQFGCIWLATDTSTNLAHISISGFPVHVEASSVTR